jgi:hypothetical protein
LTSCEIALQQRRFPGQQPAAIEGGAHPVLGNALAIYVSMANDDIDIDHEEIDRLVKELAAPPKAPAPTPAVAPPAAATAMPPAAMESGGRPPGRRWSTVRLLMPAARTEPRNPFAFASAINLPQLPAINLTALTETQWDTLSVRMFVALGVVLGAAMPHWPYANAWSWGLMTYLAAVMLVVVTGIWGAKLSWDARLPAAHTVAIGTVIWGMALLAAEAVPRIVYA